MMTYEMSQGDAFFTPDDGVPGDIKEDMRHVRALAAGVVHQAIEDLQLDVSLVSLSLGVKRERQDDVVTALEFLFGFADECGGWLGLLDITPEKFRRELVRTFEAQRYAKSCAQDSGVELDRGAQIKRANARRALARISDYVLHMSSIRAGVGADWNGWPKSFTPT